MLLLDSKMWELDGVTVLPDHADAEQFWYMPLAPHLSMRRDAGGAEVPQFSLIAFKDAAGNGGFLNFDVNLGLPRSRFDALLNAVRQQTGVAAARLAPIPLIDGSVRLLMLGADSAAAPAEGAPAGTGPRFVETISHPATPSLYGDNQATFSIQLGEEGAETLMQTLEGEILPIAVVYSLQYLGLRPAYHVRLDVDWDRVQKHMDESFGANFLFFSTEIGKAVDELVDSRAIQFVADSFLDEETEGETTVAGRRDAAIAQVRAMITETFFQPSLPPWKNDGAEWASDLKKAQDVMNLVGGGPAATTAMFSYKKTEYERTDRKSLNVDFSERTTVRRSIHPQGHLAGLLEPLRAPGVDRARFVTQVDLGNPWFERRRLAVRTESDFDSDQIGSINVRARYNGELKNAILTKAAPTAAFDWSSKLDGNTMHMPVELSYEVRFAGIDATERPQTLASPVRIEEGEATVVDPRDLYAVSPIPIDARSVPWDRYPDVEVHTRYEDPANSLALAEVFRLDEDHQEAMWNIFVLDRARRRFSYRLVYRGADNRNRDTGWTETDDEAVTVSDPFPRKREVTVVASVDWTQVDRCFVDVTYEDAANGIAAQKSLEFIEGDRSKSVTFEMQDPEHKLVGYSALILRKDGSSIEIPQSQTVDNRVLIRPDMRGHRLVEIRPPADFAHLARITAELRFEDLAASLSFADRFEFTDGSGPRIFEYDFVAPDRSTYQIRVTTLFDNGLQKVADWANGQDALVRLAAA